MMIAWPLATATSWIQIVIILTGLRPIEIQVISFTMIAHVATEQANS